MTRVRLGYPTKEQLQSSGSWDRYREVEPNDMLSGAAVQITIPDMGVLDEGWRILAVCPPNAQRRPDYILGRTKQRSS